MAELLDPLVQEYLDESDSSIVIYTEFVTNFRKNSKEYVYCFYEGRDDNIYYNLRVENLSGKTAEWFNCNGKDNVVDIQKMISNIKEYMHEPILYFVDKDYSNNEYISKDIYITPCYSIENFYVNLDSFKKIIRGVFNMTSSSEDYTLAVNLYTEAKIHFHKEILFLNKWLACQNDLREQNNLTHLKIDDTLSDYFNEKFIINNQLKLDMNYDDTKDIEKLQKDLFKNSPIISEEFILSKKEIFKDRENCFFRGKFELKFLSSFLKQMNCDIGRKKNRTIFIKRHKCTLKFEFENILSNLSVYATTPKCLENYIKLKLAE